MVVSDVLPPIAVNSPSVSTKAVSSLRPNLKGPKGDSKYRERKGANGHEAKKLAGLNLLQIRLEAVSYGSLLLVPKFAQRPRGRGLWEELVSVGILNEVNPERVDAESPVNNVDNPGRMRNDQRPLD